jgi:hypothetical protein
MFLLQALDLFFLVFHAGWILFCALGWAWRATRRANLLVLLLTLASWTLLGFWYGFGFCPFTEWHWQVREALGRSPDTSSYIKFLLDALTGWDVRSDAVDAAAVVGLAVALLASITLNLRDRRRAKPCPSASTRGEA